MESGLEGEIGNRVSGRDTVALILLRTSTWRPFCLDLQAVSESQKAAGIHTSTLSGVYSQLSFSYVLCDIGKQQDPCVGHAWAAFR